MHFEFDAYHIILTGASDLKLFVGGVNPYISRDTRIKIFTTRNIIWLMKQKIIVTKFDSATNQPRFLSLDVQGLGQSNKTLHFSHGRSWKWIWYLTCWTYYPCDRFTIAAMVHYALRNRLWHHHHNGNRTRETWTRSENSVIWSSLITSLFRVTDMVWNLKKSDICTVIPSCLVLTRELQNQTNTRVRV